MAPSNSNHIHKVVYKPSSQSTEEYTVLVNPEEYKRYKEGDTSVALALVVESFEIFHSTQGKQGILGRPSKQQLETQFDTSKPEEAIKKILELGTLQPGEAPSGKWTEVNNSRGGGYVDTRGSSLRG